ncbi:MAG: hypothetical protein ACK55I_12005, partial [bacterium]
MSEGFRPYFESRFPSQRFSFHTNGIDDDFLDSSPVGTEVRAPDLNDSKNSSPLRTPFPRPPRVGSRHAPAQTRTASTLRRK